MWRVQSGSSTVHDYEYDDAGNVIERQTGMGSADHQTVDMFYDQLGRVKSVTDDMAGPGAPQSVTYTYDINDIRVRQTEGTETTIYVGQWWEKNVTTNDTTSYYFANGSMVAVDKTGEGLRYLFSDHLGSSSVSVKANGTDVRRQRYEPFGGLRGENNSRRVQHRRDRHRLHRPTPRRHRPDVLQRPLLRPADRPIPTGRHHHSRPLRMVRTTTGTRMSGTTR